MSEWDVLQFIVSSKEEEENITKIYKNVQQIVKEHGSEIRKSEANNLQLDLYCNQ